MNVIVMDAQGGGIGRMLVEKLKAALPEQEIIAVGTNAMATAAMMRAGAARGATGENAVCVTAKTADLILGPIGIVLADAMLGEVTARMAAAVGSCAAHKILIPVNRSGVSVAGTAGLAREELVHTAVEEAVRRIGGDANCS